MNVIEAVGWPFKICFTVKTRSRVLQSKWVRSQPHMVVGLNLDCDIFVSVLCHTFLSFVTCFCLLSHVSVFYVLDETLLLAGSNCR